MKFLNITVWDSDAARIAGIERKLHVALRECGAKGRVDSMSEPPLLARRNLTYRVPVLEIDGVYWSQQPMREFSREACLQLVRMALARHGE